MVRHSSAGCKPAGARPCCNFEFGNAGTGWRRRLPYRWLSGTDATGRRIGSGGLAGHWVWILPVKSQSLFHTGLRYSEQSSAQLRVFLQYAKFIFKINFYTSSLAQVFSLKNASASAGPDVYLK